MSVADAIKRTAMRHAEEAGRVVQVGVVTDITPLTVELEDNKVLELGDELEMTQAVVAYNRDTGIAEGDSVLVARRHVGGEILWLLFEVMSDVEPAAGGGGGTSTPATTTALGIVELSHAPADPVHPVVVEDSDPRNTNARTPLAHVHSESDVTGLGTDLANRVQIGGDLGGTPTAPTVPALTGKEDKANKGVANGYAPLDSGLLVPVANLPVATGAVRGIIKTGTGVTDAMPGNTRLDQIAAPTAPVSMGTQRLTNVLDPTVAQDAATKAYVDTHAGGGGTSMAGTLAAMPAASAVAAGTLYDAIDDLGTQRYDAQAPAIGARIRRSTPQSIPNGGAAITFDVVRWDSDTMWAAATPTRLTVRTAGMYAIAGSLQFSGAAGGSLRLVRLQRNGSELIAEQQAPMGAGFNSYLNVETVYQLAAGDYIELIAYQDSGGALSTNLPATEDVQELAMVRVPGTSYVQIGPQAPAIGARVYNSVALSIPSASGGTPLTFDSERYDSDTIHDTATNTNRLTCRTAGLYSIKGSVSWVANTTGYRQIFLQVVFAAGGSKIIASDQRAPEPGGGCQQTVAADYQLSPGDYVQLSAQQNSGGALNVQSSDGFSPEFEMVRIPGSQGAALSATSTLPSNPVDGQECYYLADAANGVVWHLKYRLSVTRWECVGGGVRRGLLANRPAATFAAGIRYYATDAGAGTLYQSDGTNWLVVGSGFVPQVLAVYSDSGADANIPNDSVFRTVAKASGNLGDGTAYVVPAGETHIVKVSGRLVASADSSNWTNLGARIYVWNATTATRVQTGTTIDRSIFYGYNGSNVPDWNDLRPESIFTLTAGTYNFYMEVRSENSTGSFGGFYTRGPNWNQIIAHRIG